MTGAGKSRVCHVEDRHSPTEAGNENFKESDEQQGG